MLPCAGAAFTLRLLTGSPFKGSSYMGRLFTGNAFYDPSPNAHVIDFPFPFCPQIRYKNGTCKWNDEKWKGAE
ncbi:hypothetical protein POVCU1_015970 [Plasmodium ovale curtisi]|uniref:Uncharacterized protein n=1 Tax=Plasmodium ovale curtisi TaxID=864141 RepID=A0A1A8W6T4_PLAOA|nr:hypothetical protein POVCU1_015970 [Plasmodium ovale curtisi]